jgi:hypothetical protein
MHKLRGNKNTHIILVKRHVENSSVMWFFFPPFFDVSLTVHLSITLVNDQLDAQILIHLLQSSTYTCFEQYLTHPQEVKLY